MCSVVCSVHVSIGTQDRVWVTGEPSPVCRLLYSMLSDNHGYTSGILCHLWLQVKEQPSWRSNPCGCVEQNRERKLLCSCVQSSIYCGKYLRESIFKCSERIVTCMMIIIVIISS